MLCMQELRQMEQISKPNIGVEQLHRRKSLSIEASETSQLKSELLLMTKRFERLEAKEKRMIVSWLKHI